MKPRQDAVDLSAKAVAQLAAIAWWKLLVPKKLNGVVLAEQHPAATRHMTRLSQASIPREKTWAYDAVTVEKYQIVPARFRDRMISCGRCTKSPIFMPGVNQPIGHEFAEFCNQFRRGFL